MADARRSPKNTKKTTKKSGWRRFFTWFGITVLVLMLAGAGVLGFAYATVKLPDPNADFQTNTSFVYFNDGKEKLGSYQIQNRQTLAYEDIPQNVKDAIVAGENRTFWTDPGISIPGIARAVVSVVRGEDVVGGSTITQQYIKVLYLNQEKTLSRKFKEILLAAKMGNEMSKEEILGGYLNTVYFGRGAYGIEAAAQAYFGKPAAKLTDAQAIALTSIVNNPGNLDPAKGDKQAADLLERYQYTINGMVEMGTMTEAQKNEIYAELPEFPKVERDSQFGGPKGFLLNMVQDELKAKGFTEEQINGGGLSIITTFDAKAQEAAVKAAQKITADTAATGNKKAKNLHAGLASIDVETGGVLALYGGPDFVKDSRNWATTARPTGSTFKPYALGAALDQGFTLNDKLNGSQFTPPGENTPVRNAGDRNYGTVNLLQATTNSINTAYVDLEGQMDDGPENTLAFAEAAGLPKAAGWEPISRVPLGIPEVSPLSQATGYATFARDGKHIDTHVVAQVKDASGAVVYAADTSAEQTVDADVANDVAYALTNVVQDGTAARAGNMGFPIAGKTGTYYIRDAAGGSKTTACWFVGMSKQIATAVMYVAGDEGTDDLNDYYPAGFFGSGPPLSTWMSYMSVAQDGLKDIAFDGPTQRVSTQSPTAPARTSQPTRTSNPSATAAQPTTEPTTEPSTEPTTQPTVEPSNGRPTVRPSATQT
ncbi:transglycosylase domain-containing protein [Micropruina glycogenica]|uniref:Putative penicillin binding protein n=1 Tax=Micropruina glycogenica TaxID=75385 RepID=A0A2N9JKJ1_9ACTN|nr:transglycosylase domain-containing protein [Micropruina glycogenica]SPD88078.1 putative penicillin binding protein [Micropruina glycogenica]